MSQMNNLYLNIEEQLTKGRIPSIIAEELEVPIHWVYEVQADMYAELPDLPVPTDEELTKMANYYERQK